MAGKFFKWLRRYIITIWLVLAVSTFIGIISYAAYTSTHTAKSVVATRKGSGSPFSSNYLEVGSLTKHIVSINKDSTDPSINITVCNYPQGNPARFSTDEIIYDLVATLVKEDGTPYASDSFEGEWYSGYSVVFENTVKTFTDSLTVTFENASLAAYDQSMHTYSIHFPVSQLKNKNVFVKLEAIPKSGSDGISQLSRYLGISPKTVKNVTGWTGKFIDNVEIAPAEYDGFNYRISGSGQANVTLKWNTEYVNISKWFVDELGSDVTIKTDTHDENIRYIEFPVDSSVINSYTIQFYRTKEANAVNEKWEGDDLVYGTEKIPFVIFSAESSERSTPISS